MGDLRPHFSRWEFRCGCGCGADDVSDELLDALERLRALAGNRPLDIVSGVRCVPYNRRVGGIRTSQHLAGRAADIRGGYARAAQVRDAGFAGCGVRNGRVIHVDVTPGRSFFMFND